MIVVGSKTDRQVEDGNAQLHCMPNKLADYVGSSCQERPESGCNRFDVDSMQARCNSLCAQVVQCCLHQSNALPKAMLLLLSMLYACNGTAFSTARPTSHICNSDGFNKSDTCLAGQVNCSFAGFTAHLASILELGIAVQGELDVCMLNFCLIQWAPIAHDLTQGLLAQRTAWHILLAIALNKHSEASFRVLTYQSMLLVIM